MDLIRPGFEPLMADAPTYYVAADRLLPDGRRLLHARLSRPLPELGTCRRVLKRVQRHQPDAYAVRVINLR